MTLGKKLSGYRKLAGLTQQQLGERLNLSAQAISKWETDLAEPDLATLRALASIYKVSLDDLLDLEKEFAVQLPEEEAEETKGKDEETPSAVLPIGFCKDCGVTVNEENLGEREPVILCKRCVEAREEAKRKAAEEKKRKEEAAKKAAAQKKAKNQADVRAYRAMSLVTATLVTLAFVGIMIAVMVKNFEPAQIAVTIIGGYGIFAFISQLFFDGTVSDVVFDWSSKSFHAPGLIFTFDLDGFIWLIAMKILFWIIGLLFAAVVFLIGVTLGFICGIFVFPFKMRAISAAIKKGTELEELKP